MKTNSLCLLPTRSDRSILRILLMIAAMIGLAGCTTTPRPNSRSDTAGLSAADESAVRSVVSEFARTWNRHDMKAMHELNTADVEWINVTANHWRGNAATFKGHDNIHRTVFAKTDMVVDQTLVRAIAPDVAVAVATMKFGPVTIPSGQVLPELRTRGSFTMVKHGGQWKIAHFQNTNIDVEAEKNDPITWDETGFLPGRK